MMEIPTFHLPAEIMMDDDPSLVRIPENLIKMTEMEQGPFIVKGENISSKITLKTGKELEMVNDCVSNENIRYPMLQDSFEPSDSELTVLSEHYIEDMIRTLPSTNAVDSDISDETQFSDSVTNGEFFGIYVLPSERRKNSPYLVKGKAITTKNMTPVKFIVSGVKATQQVCVSMRYIDEFYEKEAVRPCRNHQDWKEKSNTSNFNFYITTACSYVITESGHPTAVLNIQGKNTAGDGTIRFSVVFLCLNSCEPHRLRGKRMKLVITLNDHTSSSLVGEEHFTIRACKNVKRDHKEKSAYAMKHKNSPAEEDQGEDLPRIIKVEHKSFEESYLSCDTSKGRNDDAPRKITFQMKSREDEDLILNLIDRLDGVKWFTN